MECKTQAGGLNIDIPDILKLTHTHRDRIKAKYDAIANGTEEAEPNYLYYLQGILDTMDLQIEIFDTVIRGKAASEAKANELLKLITFFETNPDFKFNDEAQPHVKNCLVCGSTLTPHCIVYDKLCSQRCREIYHEQNK